MNNNLTGLTSAQTHKYYSLLSSHGHEQAKLIALNLASRGKHGYTAFVDKYESVLLAKREETEYHDEIYAKFNLDEDVEPGAIIQGICDIRYQMELDRYTTKLKLRCEADFFGLFVVRENYEEVQDENGKLKRVITSYTPVVRVRPDQI